ncbi:unnamed protein product, partial [marine sediment metagenome]
MTMIVKHYKRSVTNPTRMINPLDVITENCTRLDTVLRYMNQLRPKRVTDYVRALEKRLSNEIGSFKIDYTNLDLDDKLINLEFLSRYCDLKNLIVLFSLNTMNLPIDYIPELKETEVGLLDWLKATNVFRYHRVKAIVDIMDREEGIQLWKDLVYRATEDAIRTSDEEIHPPIKEITEGWMREGENGQSNFELTVVSYDDHKVALRFDRCPVFDSVKHLEDREIAYLSYCWTGESEAELNKKL